MVQTCVFCKKNVLRYPDLSFHSFPKNGYRKKIWLHNLGLENTKYWHRVCSNHFEARDFKFYTSKLRVLNNKAVPHLNIDKQICYNTIETKNDENVSTSNEVKDVESDTNLTLEHNISSPTTSERFPKDENRRLQWIQALHRENFVPTNNTLICEEHFTTNDYQKRPDLIKLTNTAVPSIFNNQDNERQNTSHKRVTMDSELKSSRLPARKRHSNLSDHTYVLKPPEELIVSDDKGFQKIISPSECVVHTLHAGESHMSDISKSNIQTLNNIENPGCEIPDSVKITIQPPQKNWENIAMTQKKTIHDLRKKIKVLNQKIRRYGSTIDYLKGQLDVMIRF